jgi:hypothetical protein
MSVMSTLGIRPGGGCHHPPEGYIAMASRLFPLVNQYNYGEKPKKSITAPMIESVYFTDNNQDEITLTFDQDVKWEDEVAWRFYLDGSLAEAIAIEGSGKVISVKLAASSTAKTMTYIKGGKWKKEEAIIRGSNKIAALTFCEVPIRPARSPEQ